MSLKEKLEKNIRDKVNKKFPDRNITENDSVIKDFQGVEYCIEVSAIDDEIGLGECTGNGADIVAHSLGIHFGKLETLNRVTIELEKSRGDVVKWCFALPICTIIENKPFQVDVFQISFDKIYLCKSPPDIFD
jgi:hypothetical protein